LKYVFLFVGLLIGFGGGAGVVFYQFVVNKNPNAGELDIVFPQKFFYDTDKFVAMSGTLTGKGLGYPNNTYSIGCYQDTKECWYTYVDAIGANLIGRMDAPSAYEIRSWTTNEIVAGDDAPFGCFKTTITIARKTQQLLWIEEPVNQTKPFCKDSSNEVRKYSIEDSPGYKRIHSR
jgi:hypothetical protein